MREITVIDMKNAPFEANPQSCNRSDNVPMRAKIFHPGGERFVPFSSICAKSVKQTHPPAHARGVKGLSRNTLPQRK